MEIQKGLLHYVTLATKLLHTVLFHEDITQLEQKNPALGIHVIKAYTEFQQYLCIIFENIYGSWYSKWLAWTQCFNAKIRFEKYSY